MRIPTDFECVVVYTSATVLLVDRIRSKEQWLSKSVWVRAIQVLKAYSKVGKSAERCVAALEILLAKIQGRYHSQQSEKPGAETSPMHDLGTQDGAVAEQGNEEGLREFDDIEASLNLAAVDLGIDDSMLWLNSSVADILF